MEIFKSKIPRHEKNSAPENLEKEIEEATRAFEDAKRAYDETRERMAAATTAFRESSGTGVENMQEKNRERMDAIKESREASEVMQEKGRVMADLIMRKEKG